MCICGAQDLKTVEIRMHTQYIMISLFNRFAHSAGPDCMAVCLQAMGNCELVFGNALGSSTVLGRYLGKVGARIFFAEYHSKMCRHVFV